MRGRCVGKSSNLFTCIKGRPQCRKSATAYGTPYTNPTQLLGAWKRQKEITGGMTGVETAYVSSNPCEGSVDPEVLNSAAHNSGSVHLGPNCGGLQQSEVDDAGKDKVLVHVKSVPFFKTVAHKANYASVDRLYNDTIVGNEVGVTEQC